MDKKLFLIDGHSLIFKMHYAFWKHPMINSKGMDTSILFGFTKYLFELIEKEQPTHIAVAFDPPGKTFRHEMYPAYKGTRSETPQQVIDALEPLIEICKALNIPVLMEKGYEADDVIGTVATAAGNEGFKVYMVTPDKDYGQLVTSNIYQYKPGKAGSENEILSVSEVCSKYGIENPKQVIDMLTICGDTSDNVPGVKGVGEVGAGKLIAKYGSVKEIYAHIDELKPKQREAFEAAKSHIELSHKLVTINTQVPIKIDTKSMELDFDFNPDISDLFAKYEFSSLKKHIKHIKAASAQEEKIVEKLPEADIKTAKEVSSLAKSLSSCTIYPSYQSDNSLAGVSKLYVCILQETENGPKPVIAEGSVEDFRNILEDKGICKSGYNLKKLYKSLMMESIVLEGKLYDLELMHYLLNPEENHKIESLSIKYLGINIEDSKEDKEPRSLFDMADEEETEEPQNKVFTEISATSFIAERLKKEMADEAVTKLYDEIEEPLVKVLAQMEAEGIKIDLEQLHSYAGRLRKELEERQATIRQMADEPDLNISSPKQIGVVIFEKLKLDPKVKAKKGARYSYHTDEETLNALADKHPIINEILEFRGVKKLLSTYIEPFPEYVSPKTGRIHTTFNQAQTATGRLSSSSPNLQNIPIRTERGKEIRKAFIPRTKEGFILSADYSQIELRIMAHLCNDSHLIEAFKSNKDVHASTAAKIFNIPIEEVTKDQRRMAKTANFGIMYGISAFGLSQKLGTSRSEAKKLIDDYFENFPAISTFISGAVEFARKNGYAETLFGRKRFLPDINSQNAALRSLAERNAVNAPIQGTAADIIKKAMINIDKALKDRNMQSKMVLQIHDELVFDTVADEVEELQKLVAYEMENVIKLSIPLTVECNYGNNWLEAH